jgi:hypothetical protein
MASIDYIGKNAALKALNKFNFDGIRIKAGASKIPFSSVIHEGENQSDLIDRLEIYFNERLESNANDAEVLEMQLLDEKGKKIANFNFTLSHREKAEKDPAIRGLQFAEMNVEHGRLQAENEFLRVQNEELQNQILELETQLDESDTSESQPDYVGEVIQAAKPYLPVIFEKIAGLLSQPTQTQPGPLLAVNGVGEVDPEVLDCVNAMIAAGATKSHFKALANIAKTSPTKFKMYLQML